MKASQPEGQSILSQFMSNIGQVKDSLTGQIISGDFSLEKAAPAAVKSKGTITIAGETGPKSHAGWATRRKGGAYPYWKKEYAHLYRQGRRRKAPSKMTAYEERAAVQRLGEITRKKPVSSYVPRRGGIMVGGVKRHKIPSMKIDPVTGQRRGPGVARVPSELGSKAKYIGTQQVSGMLTGTIQSMGQYFTNRADQYMKEKVHMARMSPRQRAKWKALQVKRRYKEDKLKAQYRAAGLWEEKKENIMLAAFKEGLFGGTIRAAQNTASAVTDILGRYPKLSPIKIAIDPYKFRGVLDYYDQRRRRNVFAAMAEAEMNSNVILQGVRAGDPEYMTDQAFAALDRWQTLGSNLRQYAEKKHGKGWVRAKAEREKESFAALYALTKKLYGQARQAAVVGGIPNPDEFAYHETKRALGGKDPAIINALGKLYTAVNTMDAPNITRKLEEVGETENLYELKQRAKQEKARIDAIEEEAIKRGEKLETFAMPSQKVIPKESSKESPLEGVYEEIRRKRRNVTAKKRREKKRVEIWAEQDKAGVPRTMFYDKPGRPTRASKRPPEAPTISEIEERGRQKAKLDVFENTSPESLIEYARRYKGGTRAKKWLRSLRPQHTSKEAAEERVTDWFTEEFGVNPGNRNVKMKAAQFVDMYEKQAQARILRTQKVQMTEDLRKIASVRNMMGIVNRMRGVLNKQITSTPVSGLSLVRENLAGGKRKKRRRIRRKRRYVV